MKTYSLQKSYDITITCHWAVWDKFWLQIQLSHVSVAHSCNFQTIYLVVQFVFELQLQLQPLSIKLKLHICMKSSSSSCYGWIFHTVSEVILLNSQWQVCIYVNPIDNKPNVEPRPQKSLNFNLPYLKNLRRFWNEQVVCFIIPWNLYAQQISWS